MESDRITIGTLLVCLAAIAVVETVAHFVIPACTCDPLLVVGAARIIETALILLTVTKFDKGLSSIGLMPSTMFQGCQKGLIWSGLFGLATAFAFITLFLMDIDPFALIKVNLPKTTAQKTLFFAVAGIIGPIAEEVFFRGVLYGFLRRWGIMIALFGSTLLFVLAHPGTHGLFLPQIIGGLLFALSYEVERTLIVPIAIHILGNMALFTLSLIF